MGSDMMFYQRDMDRSNKNKHQRNNKKIMVFLEETKKQFDTDLMPWGIADFRYNVCLMRSDLDTLLDSLEEISTIE